MRKLLLASVAMLGGAVALAGTASAQMAAPSYSGGGYGLTGLQNPSAGGPSLPGLVPGQPGTGTAVPGTGSNPPMAPGNVVVRVDGRINAYAGAGWGSGSHPGTFTTNSNGVNSVQQQNTKVTPLDMWLYSRLYFSMDAMAANGLKYGGFIEARQDTGAAAGSGVVGGGTSASVVSRGNLYLRREFAYVGADNLGFIRYGTTDSVTGLFLTGNFENFNDGGWDGDTNLVFGNESPTWLFEDVGNIYAGTRVVYVSPQFFHMVDFGVSFEPGTGNEGGGPGCSFANTAAPTVNIAVGNNASACDMTSASNFWQESRRRRNTVDGAVRLRTALGPVGIAATAGGFIGGSVQYDGTDPNVVRYDGLKVYDFGLQATYGGFAIGGHVNGGRVNGSWALAPKHTPNALNWLVGTSYAFGPVVVGAHYLQYQSAGQEGAVTLGNGESNAYGVGKRNEYGVAAGGTLTMAPGAFLFLSYLYGHRHELGYDFLGGGTSNATQNVTTHNNVQAQAIYVGTQFRW
jgi:hypothetical protein